MSTSYKRNDLFRNGPNRNLNACVGRNGRPCDLRSYSRGYFRAAEALAKHIAAGPIFIDTLIYPLV